MADDDTERTVEVEDVDEVGDYEAQIRALEGERDTLAAQVKELSASRNEARLGEAKARRIAGAFLRKGIDIDEEMKHVSGIEVDDAGTVTGEGAYRPPRIVRTRATDAGKELAAAHGEPQSNGAAPANEVRAANRPTSDLVV